MIFWDDRINKYVAYMRRNQLRPAAEPQRRPQRIGSPQRLCRGAGRADRAGADALESNWATARGGLLHQRGHQVSLGAGRLLHVPPGLFPLPARAVRRVPKGVPVNAGPLDTRFAASRDGITWNRFDRRPFVGWG